MMININSLKCSCGCQKDKSIDLTPEFLELLKAIDIGFGLKSNSIIGGYRCQKQLQQLIDLAKSGNGNMPAKNSKHCIYPLIACDIFHENIKDIFRFLCVKCQNKYGFGLYLNSNGSFSMHMDVRADKMRWVCNLGKYIYLHNNEKMFRFYLKKWGVNL